MENKFINKDKVFVNTTKIANIIMDSTSYSEFHEKLESSDIECEAQKTYEIASSGFIDFNQHLFEDINEMNSLSCGIYLEMSLVTFRIFIWSSKGEGFEIFKHVLLKDEIENLKTNEDFNLYLYKHMSELEEGIVKTYNKNVEKCFEDFGMAIESKQLPLNSILQFISIENNMKDFR